VRREVDRRLPGAHTIRSVPGHRDTLDMLQGGSLHPLLGSRTIVSPFLCSRFRAVPSASAGPRPPGGIEPYGEPQRPARRRDRGPVAGDNRPGRRVPGHPLEPAQHGVVVRIAAVLRNRTAPLSTTTSVSCQPI